MSENSETPISRAELIALLAMLAATVAFSIDAMLPVFPDIAASLSPNDPNRVQLVIATFVLGMGLGTFVAGPLSDAFGRQKIALFGAIVYIGAALISAVAPTIEVLLAARFLQGLGASGPRVVALAITRDLFAGRQMARVVSFVMIVFTLVPVFAPTMGAAIAWAFGWRAIFFTFALFSIISIAWLRLRLPETLTSENRRTFQITVLLAGTREIMANSTVARAIAVQTLIFSMLFIALMTSQPVFDQYFDKEDSFPFWFGAIAAVSATSSLINANIVLRFGMQSVVKWALIVQCIITAVYAVILFISPNPTTSGFAIYVFWQISVFCMAGFGIGNMNAIAMEPMGHMAGLTASIMSAAATVAAVILATPVSLAFDGTPLPSILGVLGCGLVAWFIVSQLKETTQED